MKTIHKEELYIKQDDLTDTLFDDVSIFFDIETTGFSPATSSIYLIGCARKKGKYIYIDQFFAENPSEESIVLQSFMDLLKDYTTIISFNGVGFDIPFLKAKCDTYKIPENFKNYQYLDIFKSISSVKFLLKLDNYKQKTIEKFLGLHRDDSYSGGELINVYYNFIEKKDEESLNLLLLHNFEDIIGMTELLPILSYVELLKGQYSITEIEISPYTSYSGDVREELIIKLRNDYILPKRVSYQAKDVYLTFNRETTQIRVPIYKGELKYFYSNYKDYYYLPEEDQAIHKSVASFVDKDYREKCHAYNCYSRKVGTFLIQYSSVMSPEFKVDYKDKHTYFELTDDFISSDVMLRRYVDHIMTFISK